MTTPRPHHPVWGLVLGLAACVEPAATNGPNGPSLPGAPGDPNGPEGGPSPSLDGALLYVSYGCDGCHGPLSTSTKRNATIERIRAAAGPDSRIEPMRSILLTDPEIRALVLALADGSSGIASDRRRPFLKPLLLTRSEAASRLFSIFRSGPGAPVNELALRAELQEAIGRQSSFLGGHCNIYDGCGVAEIDASENPSTSVVRAGLFIRTCVDLLARPGSKAAVLAKAGLRPEDPVDANGVASLWDVFAPGRPLPSVTADLIVREAGAAPEWDAPLYFFCRPAVLEAI